MGSQVTFNQGFSTITVYYVVAFALVIHCFRQLIRIYLKYKVCRHFRYRGMRIMNKFSRQISLSDIVTVVGYLQTFPRNGHSELIGS